MMNYNEAKNVFATARNKDKGKPIANNTRLMRRNGDFAVQLHDTDVVTIHENNTYTLNSGGWRTVTTKERINAFAPCNLYQEKRVWYVSHDWKEPASLYEDGMRIDTCGKPLRFVDPKPHLKQERKLQRMISKYVKGFCGMIEKGELEDPSGRDCLDCSFGMGGMDHLFSHFEENYFVPSLLYRAFKEKGYRDVGFIWSLVKQGQSHFARLALRGYFDKRRQEMLEWMA